MAYTKLDIYVFVIIVLEYKKIIIICLFTGKEVQYKLNYCTEPPTERTCENDEIAVVMSGVLYPDVVDTVNCACPNNEYNLHLKRAYFVSPFRISHEFVCQMVSFISVQRNQDML